MTVLTKLRALANGFYSKLLLALFVSIPLSALVGDWLYAPVTGPSLSKKAPAIAAEFDVAGGELDADELLNSMNKLGLSWLYVTDTAGNINNKYKQFAPDLPKYSLASRLVTWHNQRYFEVTSPEANRVIHAGYRMEPLYDLLHGSPVPSAYALFIILAGSAATASCFFVTVGGPIKRIAPRLQRVLGGARVDDDGMNSLLVASQVRQLDASIMELAAAAQGKVTKEINEARNDLREVIARERQQKFINRLAQDLQEMDSSARVCQAALHKVQDRFSSVIKVGMAYRLQDGVLKLTGQFGLTVEQARNIRKLDSFPTLQKPLESGLSSVTRGNIPEIKLPSNFNPTMTFAGPLVQNGNQYGLLVFCVEADNAMFESINPILKDVIETTSKVLPNLVAYENEVEANRTDELTGITKLKYLNNYMEKLKGQVIQDEPVAALLIEGDGFMMLNEKYGRQTGDLLIKELCKLVVSVVSPDERGMTIFAELESTVFRYSAAQFLAIIRQCDAKKAASLAERIRRLVEQHQGWPSGVAGWTVSIGIAVVPDHVGNLAQLVSEAEIARDYIKQNKKTNAASSIEGVPSNFRQRRQGNELGGTLNVFNPAALLQSIANTGRTGLLDVVGKQGEKLSVYLENGEPKRAKLKKLCGNDALIEFVSTFDDGNFNFREFRNDAATASIIELTGLGTRYDLTKPLFSILMDAALAADHIAMAKKVIPQSSLYLIKELKAADPSAWERLKNQDEPPTEAEVLAMNDIINFGAGAATLNEVISRLESYPSATIWRAAQLLLEHKMIKLSPVKMLATL